MAKGEARFPSTTSPTSLFLFMLAHIRAVLRISIQIRYLIQVYLNTFAVLAPHCQGARESHRGIGRQAICRFEWKHKEGGNGNDVDTANGETAVVGISYLILTGVEVGPLTR